MLDEYVWGDVQRAQRGVQQLLRVDEEDLQPVNSSNTEQILDRLRPRIGRLDAVLVSDYNKGLVTHEVVREIVEAQGGRVAFVDRIPAVSTTRLLDEASGTK